MNLIRILAGLGGLFLEINLYFVNPNLEFLHFLTGIPGMYIHIVKMQTYFVFLKFVFVKFFKYLHFLAE